MFSNGDIHIEALHLSEYHFIFYLVNCLGFINETSGLKQIYFIAAVCLTILSHLCSLFKFSKHYSSIRYSSLFISILNFVIVLKESEF